MFEINAKRRNTDDADLTDLRGFIIYINLTMSLLVEFPEKRPGRCTERGSLLHWLEICFAGKTGSQYHLGKQS